jgi:hypothetical protein
MIPAFTSWGHPACDKEGDMYFHVGGFLNTEILRLSADGSEGKTFRLSDQFPEASKFGFTDFSVTPGGNVYVLVVSAGGKNLLLRFDEDGTMAQPISPRLPKGVIGDTLLATDSGPALFFGYYDSPAPPELKGKSYLALLDSSGAAYEVHLSIPGLDVAKLASGEASSPGAALGDDGNFYLAATNQILVVAPDGDLVRRIPFENPDPKTLIARLMVSGGVIVVAMDRLEEHVAHDSYLVLLNPSGAKVGYYAPAKEIAGWPAVCYSPKQGLIFLKVQNRQLKLLNVPLQ